MSFENLGLSEELLRTVKKQGYSIPTPIQIKAIPSILNKQDIMGTAQTGTGKTAGFTLPLLQRLMQERQQGHGRRHIKALIVTPTRELAAQVCKSVETYGRNLPLRSTVVFGGVSISAQVRKLQSGVDILVATPGRLLDHVNRNTADLSRVDILILDEADRMLDMGFLPDIKRIISLLPKKRQNLLFSATFSNEIKKLAMGLLNNPTVIEVAAKNTASELVSQVVHHVDRKRKQELLSHIIDTKKWERVLVFTRTKSGANKLAEQLTKKGIRSTAIHGNKSQAARTKALDQFKREAVRVLVATDIAARGLDIQQLPHVVNFDMPNVPEDYVHRIGRTGRAGHEGEALSLVCIDEIGFLRNIERMLNTNIPKMSLKGYEPDPSIKAEPIQRRGQRGRNGSNNSYGRSNRSFDRTSRNDRNSDFSDRDRSDDRRPKSPWQMRCEQQKRRNRYGKRAS
ncbi:MAG: DEAD/DEAH box helicase [bacterium]|nr:DEAD/DEAH box helicase [bacterium]MBU1916625.1 DEAD/DEAH box helicase [bacterium]